MYVEFEITQHHGRNVPGHQDGREHGRNYDVQEIIASIQRGNGNHEGDQRIHDAGASDVIVELFPKPLHSDTARQIGHGDQAD